ncbi:hypothetical protein [Streptomyces californicus]|uniref:hypothetical protein n=1 Tax=Streptomyces californicus TaxID=67351 RepID=UPI0004C02613|nr:hypothetical protein [Streptomyces californicus]QRV59429.1 hypothetical protein I6J40_34790 [Streptomyces californicus]
MTDTSMTPDAALARLRQYGERTSTWSTATYNDGTEKALHQIAVSLAAEVDRLRGELSDATAELAENARAMNGLRRHRDAAENRVRELEEEERFLERSTLPDLRRQVEHHKDGKARWRKRAETAETRVAELEARPTVGYAVWCVEQSLGDEAAQHLLDLNPDLKDTR